MSPASPAARLPNTPVHTCATVVSVTVRVLMKVCSRHGCGFFGSGGFIIFEIEEGQVGIRHAEL